MPPTTRSSYRTAKPTPAPAPNPPAASSNYIFFWGHTVTPNRPPSLAYLSQWYAGAPFVDPAYPGKTFATAEHYMMYRKALLFDPSMCDAVLASPTPAAAKKLGREVKNFDNNVWEAEADGIVEQGNFLKFGQHPQLKAYLLGTAGREIVEASPRDKIWGIGFGKDNALANIDRWGTNKLGKALERARERLAKE